MAAGEGVEPSYFGSKPNALAIELPRYWVERWEIEPTPIGPQPIVLPLHHVQHVFFHLGGHDRTRTCKVSHMGLSHACIPFPPHAQIGLEGRI